MKDTSILAFKGKEVFAGTHRERIINSLVTPLTGKEISTLTGLNQHQVMKRMSELVTSLQVFEAGTRDNQTIYVKAAKEGKEFLKMNISLQRHKNYLKALESLKNKFECEMPVDLVMCIDLELE